MSTKTTMATITKAFRQAKPREALKGDEKAQRIVQKELKEEKQDVESRDVVSTKFTEEKDAQVLREFDLNSEYGPCIGISRLERWERAHKFGLEPSQNVKDIIESHLNESKYTECVWDDYNI